MKMTTPKTLLAALTVTAMMTGSASAGTLINTYPTGSTSNIGVTASSEINGNNAAKLTLTTNNNGGDVDFNPGVLDNSTDGTSLSGTQMSWRASNTDAAGAASEWIQWDLGASYTLDSIRVWNYNDSSRFKSGIRQVDIYVSNEAAPGDPEGAGAANWTLWAVDAILDIAPGSSGYTGFDLESTVGSALPTTDVRYVRFEVDSTYFGDIANEVITDIWSGGASSSHNASLTQIEFYQVPEPGSLALLGLGGLLVASRRRRD